MKNRSNQTLLSQMQRFADITKSLIRGGNIRRAEYCMQIAEEIFKKGTTEVKNAVSNVYVFSVSTFMELHNCSIRNLFPELLLLEYRKQVNNSGV